jgi:hypothetical protein
MKVVHESVEEVAEKGMRRGLSAATGRTTALKFRNVGLRSSDGQAPEGLAQVYIVPLGTCGRTNRAAWGLAM